MQAADRFEDAHVGGCRSAGGLVGPEGLCFGAEPLFARHSRERGLCFTSAQRTSGSFVRGRPAHPGRFQTGLRATQPLKVNPA
ncbi:hypothetical protein [Lysobacter gummosus]|uniref:hypothetical protein n=1 Tax=Lysobacter gummosus TaxID=262324 RepID=UPI00362B20BF